MPANLLPALLLPAGLIAFGFLMLRQPPDRRVTWNYSLGGRLAIIVGIGGLIIGLVRLATST